MDAATDGQILPIKRYPPYIYKGSWHVPEGKWRDQLKSQCFVAGETYVEEAPPCPPPAPLNGGIVASGEFVLTVQQDNGDWLQVPDE
eukprot:9415080-Karenia_brevis.AAC.1